MKTVISFLTALLALSCPGGSNQKGQPNAAKKVDVAK